MRRVLIYGFLGVLLEVMWTGASSISSGSSNLMAHTSLWMLPIYGLGGLLFEKIHDKMKEKNIALRLIIWVALIYAVEYVSGFVLDTLFGIRPWHYTGFLSINGYITLMFVPAWLVVGIVFEKLHNYLDELSIQKEYGDKADV